MTLLVLFHVAPMLESRELAARYQLRRQIAVAREHSHVSWIHSARASKTHGFRILFPFDLQPDMAQWFSAFRGGPVHQVLRPRLRAHWQEMCPRPAPMGAQEVAVTAERVLIASQSGHTLAL